MSSDVAATSTSSVARTKTTSGAELSSAQGSTTINDAVVSKVAELAAREVRGVHELRGGGVGGTLRRLTPGADQRGSSASVEVGEKETIVELNLVVDYGVSIPQVAEAVRSNVIERVEYTTGLQVKEVNIDVSDLYFPEEDRLEPARVQ